MTRKKSKASAPAETINEDRDNKAVEESTGRVQELTNHGITQTHAEVMAMLNKMEKPDYDNGRLMVYQGGSIYYVHVAQANNIIRFYIPELALKALFKSEGEKIKVHDQCGAISLKSKDKQTTPIELRNVNEYRELTMERSFHIYRVPSFGVMGTFSEVSKKGHLVK